MSVATRVCFVRHGETAWNAAQRIQGHKDLPLNESGLEQALGVGQYFKKMTVAALYCSDLQRAQQTAGPIAVALNLPPVLLPALRERNFGRFEGMTYGEVFSASEDNARALKERHPDYVLPGGGESLNQHLQRTLECIEQLVDAHPGQTIVVVTHGGVLDLIYRRARGLPLESARDFPIPNTGINWLSICGTQWTVESWAETAHLGERGAIDLVGSI